MRVHFAEIGDVATRYYQAGEGPPLLLIHGAGMSADVWLRNIPFLASKFTVFAPDLLGHGFTDSGEPSDGAPHPALLRHLTAFVDHMGLGCFGAVGSSFGALIAGLLHLQMPHRVGRLVFASSGSIMNDGTDGGAGVGAAYRNGLRAMQNPTSDVCLARMTEIFQDPSRIPPELVFMQMTMFARPGALDAYDRRFRGMMDIAACAPFRLAHRLEAVSAPVLLIWGGDDARGRLEATRAAVGRFPNGRMVLLPNCGHHPHMEHPERFNELVGDFMSDLKGQESEAA